MISHKAGSLKRIARAAAILLTGAVLNACSSLPPGHDYPKTVTVAISDPEHTKLGAELEGAIRAHEGRSGFYLQSFGADGFLTRMQMINAAERTLDLQYFIFRGDETGRLLTDAALRAADRGVRVRILIDDGETVEGDEQITALTSHPLIEIRVFNPFRYRGHRKTIRATEFMLNKSRLNYRMHNKLLVVDNSIAVVGGRNIGDQYFQIDPEEQYADNDAFVVGPIVRDISASFDEFWNNALAIPNEALVHTKSPNRMLKEHREAAIEDPPRNKSGRSRLDQAGQFRRTICQFAIGPIAGGMGSRATHPRQPGQKERGRRLEERKYDSSASGRGYPGGPIGAADDNALPGTG